MPINIDGDLLSLLLTYLLNALLRYGQDAARATGSIIHAIGRSLDFIGDRDHGQVSKQLHVVSWREVFTGFRHIVLLAETAEELLKHHTYGMIVEGRMEELSLAVIDGLRTEVDFVGGEFIDDAAQPLRFRQVVHDLTEVQLVYDVDHILAIAVQVFGEVHFQSKRIYLAHQCLHRKLGCVVERIACDVIQNWRLVFYLVFVKLFFHLYNGILRWFEQHINAAQHQHRQNNLLVIAFVEGVYQYIIGNVPDE